MDENNNVELLEQEEIEQITDDAAALEIPDDSLGKVAGGFDIPKDGASGGRAYSNF